MIPPRKLGNLTGTLIVRLSETVMAGMLFSKSEMSGVRIDFYLNRIGMYSIDLIFFIIPREEIYDAR